MEAHPTDDPFEGCARFTEPAEGAFSLALPPGWRAQGGVARNGTDARPWYRVLSAGGGAELRASDPRVPTFIALAWGAMPMPGMVPRPYLPARGFAEEYARHFARERGAAQLAVTAWRDLDAMLRDDPRPDTRAKSLQMLQMGSDFGGASFACADRGLTGVVDVVTFRFEGLGGLVWSPFVTAMIAPTDAWPEASQALRWIARSYAASVAWQQHQSALQRMGHEAAMETIRAGTEVLRMQAASGMEAIRAHADRARIGADASASVSDAQARGWASQQASIDEGHRRAVNAVRETVDVFDPATGTVFRGAPAGPSRWWTDGVDRVVGTDGPENPDPSRLRAAADLDDVTRGRR